MARGGELAVQGFGKGVLRVDLGLDGEGRRHGRPKGALREREKGIGGLREDRPTQGHAVDGLKPARARSASDNDRPLDRPRDDTLQDDV